MSKHLVAVYGTLREGQGNWSWALDVPGAKKVGAQRVHGWKMYSTGGFPACVKSEEEDDSIEIELFLVDDAVFQSLDRLEGYPHMYDREQIETEQGLAWIYKWQRGPANLELIPDGDWVKYREGRLRA